MPCNISDALVRIEMDLKSFDAECPSVLYHAFDGALNDADRELTAQCRGSRTALYVSNNNTLLLTFRHDLWLDGADIKYQAVTKGPHPTLTPTSGADRPVFPCILMLLGVVCSTGERFVRFPV